MTVTDAIRAELDRLSDAQRQRILDFARATSTPPPPPTTGINVADLIALGEGFSSDDLKEIQQAIEEDCEHVDADSW